MSASLIIEPEGVAEVALAVREAGTFAFDFEFLSADRYIPDLCLLQLNWPGGEPVALDPQETDISAALELIADESILTIGHSAKQDLQLLFERHQLRARNFVDTQIGAAFCGLGDQMGLSRLVEAVCEVSLDKGSQFTDWSRRPLSAKQLAYALDDVRYLLDVWTDLEGRLTERDRLRWVQWESEALAKECASTTPPEEIYKSVSGVGGLRGKGLASLRELAAWREQTARDENKPPNWLMPEQAMVEACKRGARNAGDLKKLRGVGGGIVREYGSKIIAAIGRGRKAEPPPSQSKRPLEQEAQWAASILNSVVQAECRRLELAPRFVGARAQVEELVRWYFDGADSDGAKELKLLTGWRRDVLGDEVVAWLRGERAVVSDAEAGLRLLPR